MKRVEFSRYGGPEVMQIGELTLSALEPDRVRVRVKAAAINPLDWKIRQGAMKFMTGRSFPQGMGSDFAGVVEQVGAQVENFQVGDEVYGSLEVKRQGGLAEMVDASVNLLAHKPSSLSFSEAACIPIPAATAWAAIVNHAGVFPGARVLINGCSGAVGRFAVQLCRALEVDVVGTCSESALPTMVTDYVELLSYDDPKLATYAPFDAIFDTLGTLSVKTGVSMLSPSGRFLDINPNLSRMFKGYFSGRYKMLFATEGFKSFSQIADMVEQGHLIPVIGLEAPFADVLTTISQVETGNRPRGRVVMVM